MARKKAVEKVVAAPVFDNSKLAIKLSFRCTEADAARLAERARAGESASATASRILRGALSQSAVEEALGSLPTLAFAAKALVDDVPAKLAAAVLEQVSARASALIDQKISDIAASQAGREDQQRLLIGALLEGIARIEASQGKTAAAVLDIKNQFA
jgi:hypothetical protein